MLEHHHDLALEFPDHKDKIHELKQTDHHFSKLYNEYQELDKEIFRIEENIETTSDNYAEELKKKRVALKDELFQIISK